MVDFLPKDIYLRKGCLGSRFGFHQRCQESFCQIEVRKFVLDRIAVPVKSNPDHTPRRSRDNDQNMKNFTCTLSMWQLQVLQREWALALPPSHTTHLCMWTIWSNTARASFEVYNFCLEIRDRVCRSSKMTLT